MAELLPKEERTKRQQQQFAIRFHTYFTCVVFRQFYECLETCQSFDELCQRQREAALAYRHGGLDELSYADWRTEVLNIPRGAFPLVPWFIVLPLTAEGLGDGGLSVLARIYSCPTDTTGRCP